MPIMETQPPHTHGHDQGMLPNWSRTPFGRAPRHRRKINTTLTTLQPLNTSKVQQQQAAAAPAVDQGHQVEFLQKEHQAVLGSLATEVENLKLENRDLKFRLVMRDTATPKQKKRPSADKQASASGANATSDTTVLEKLRTENADLQARNTELAANQRVGAVRNISPHDFENELERLNSLNCNLLAKVAALTHELNQTRHQHHQQGSWNSTQDQVEPHVHVRVNRGANPMGGAAMTPLDYQPARPAYLDEAPTKNALADNGGTLLPANPLDGAPRFITRQRSSDGGKTRRKLNAPPQAVHLPSLNMSLDGSNSNKRV